MCSRGLMSDRASILVASLVTLALLCSAPVEGAVPSAANSTLPACLALCPLGDMSVTVVVRDIANNPIAGSSVVFDFSNAPAANLCPSTFQPGLIVDIPGRTLRAVTDLGGAVTVGAHVGGTSPLGTVRVFADGVLLRSFALASPDQDGNGYSVSIIGLDDPLFAAKLGTSDPTADFDCSGTVDIDDEQIFFQHHSHACGGFVDAARRSTWGAVKLHYR